MADGTQNRTEFDDVRHGYAPPREHNRATVRSRNKASLGDDITKAQPDINPPNAIDSIDSAERDKAPIDTADQQSGSDQKPSSAQASDTLSDSVYALLDSGINAYQAEINLLKARTDFIASSTMHGIVYMGIALSAGMVMLLALGVGSIIILSGYISNEAAVAIVVFILGLLAGIAALKAKKQFNLIAGALWKQIDE